MVETSVQICCEENALHRNALAQAKQYMPPESVIVRTSDMFRVFGDGTRARILCALSVTELCVCDLAELLAMTVSAISHQLRLMKDASLVRCRKEGKTVYYTLADDHVGRIFKLAFEHVSEEQE